MPNKSILVALGFAVSLLAPSAFASCDLSMTVTCTSGTCTAITTNNSSGSCSGTFVSYFIGTSGVSLGGITTTLGLDECFSSGDIGVPTETPFAACVGDATLGPGARFVAQVSAAGTGASSLQVMAVTGVFDPVTQDELGLVYAFSDTELA